MEIFEIKSKILKKYHLVNGQKITIKQLKEISKNEKIELKDLILILNCYKNAKYKNLESWTTIKIKQEYTKREIVNLIKIELKYLPQYGSRMYSKKELNNVCQKYRINIDDFLTYVYKYKICYYENAYILSMNKNGIWIGENTKLSVEFLNDNYWKLYKKVEKIANKMSILYNSKITKDEMIDVGINYILDQGRIEKNMSFNNERAIGKLVYKAKYKMLEKVIKAFKESNLDDIMDFVGDYDKVEQKSKIDNWLYPIKWKKIERIIIDSIQTNIEEIIKNRKRGLCMLAKRLNMEYKELYQNIENISEKLIKGNKAKVCRDGRIVIMNE